MMLLRFFFFSSRRRHTRFDCDWSSDVCSSDLCALLVLCRAPPQPAQNSNYRTAFVFAIVGNLALIGVLCGLWWRSAQHKEGAMPVQANDMSQNSNSASARESGPTAPQEVTLAPVQLSPERLQSIGVRMGRVESKIVEDEIRVTGNVAADETRLAYVQLRYSGYIQKVFADATYQYLRKGQPLFTIYSPDLAATEREYLVAKQNQRHVAASTVSGVAESAT